MSACIFCRILADELPSERLLETDSHIVILDIQPVRPGHALIVSRRHVETLTDADAALCGEMMTTAQRVAPAVLQATGNEGFNLVINNGSMAGQLIPHLHFHIIPRAGDDGIRFGWRQKKYEDGKMAEVGAAIRARLG